MINANITLFKQSFINPTKKDDVDDYYVDQKAEINIEFDSFNLIINTTSEKKQYSSIIHLNDDIVRELEILLDAIKSEKIRMSEDCGGYD